MLPGLLARLPAPPDQIGEALGWQLLGMHNLAFYHRLMKEMRERILAGNFAAYYRRAARRADARR